MLYVGMLLVHGAQMCYGEQAIKIDNEENSCSVFAFFCSDLHTQEGVMEKF